MHGLDDVEIENECVYSNESTFEPVITMTVMRLLLVIVALTKVLQALRRGLLKILT